MFVYRSLIISLFLNFYLSPANFLIFVMHELYPLRFLNMTTALALHRQTADAPGFLFLPLSVCLRTRYLLSPHVLSGGWISSSRLVDWQPQCVAQFTVSKHNPSEWQKDSSKGKSSLSRVCGCLCMIQSCQRPAFARSAFFTPYTTLRAHLCLGWQKQLLVVWKPSFSLAWWYTFNSRLSSP